MSKKKKLPEGLEVLGYPGVEGFLALVYLRDCAFAVAQEEGPTKGTVLEVGLLPASCSWNVL